MQPLDNEYLKSIQFNINANVKNVKWGKFNFTNTSGNIMHNDLVFQARSLKGEIAKGGFLLDGH